MKNKFICTKHDFQYSGICTVFDTVGEEITRNLSSKN